MSKFLYKKKNGFLRHFGFIKLGSRDLLNVAYGVYPDKEFGLSISFNRDHPFHFGLNIHRFLFVVQVLGIQRV